MQTFLLLLAASLATGYLGAYLALLHARQQDKTELREAVDELLSELRFVAEESCQRLSRERSQLEQLAQSLRENTVTAVHNNGDDVSSMASSAQIDESFSSWSQVMLWADQGKDCAQIAKELNMGQGEVELILNLVRQERSSPDYSPVKPQ